MLSRVPTANCVSLATVQRRVGAAGGVTLTGTQTLTNKTLTNPKISAINDNNGANTLTLPATTSAVNYLQLSNSSTGNGPQLTMVGSDTNISMMLIPKGTGGVQIYAPTGVTPRLVANGADANHNLNLQSKGTGVIQANGVEVATISGTQTLTNKTLTDPKVTAASGTTPTISAGAGTPEGSVTANPGSLYMRNDGGAGTSLYIKESGTGNTGWVGK